jgi:hypothetical protein
MGRISQQFEKLSKSWSRKGAVTHIAIFSFMFCVSVLGILEDLRPGDSSDLYALVPLCAVSVLNILLGFGTLRAIDRRARHQIP